MDKITEIPTGKVSSMMTYVFFVSLFLFVAVVTHGFFVNFKDNPPKFIHEVSLDSVLYKPGDPLLVRFLHSIDEKNCSVYVERQVVNQKTSDIVWTTVSPVIRDVNQKASETVPVSVGVLPPGDYYYKATLHWICGTQSYVDSSKLLSFTVK